MWGACKIEAVHVTAHYVKCRGDCAESGSVTIQSILRISDNIHVAFSRKNQLSERCASLLKCASCSIG